MKKEKLPKEKPTTFGQRLGVSLACLLFAAGFGAGGLVGIGALAHHVHGWYTTRSWQPIMVEVTKAELHSSRGRKSTTYRVAAQYRYEVGGKTYTGKRVGYGDEAADNIGEWHEDRFAELDDARKSGQPLLAWHDPKNPAEAVLDRNLRWGMVLFLLPFAVLFSAVGLGALWGLVGIWRVK